MRVTTTWRLAIAIGFFGIAALVGSHAAGAQTAPPASPSPATAPAPGSAAAGGDSEALQAAAANPLGALISVPFQYNENIGVGQLGLAQTLLNVQPVVPLSTGGGSTLIFRTIIPFVGLPALVPNGPSAAGIGDINPQFYYIAKPGKLQFGYGPTFVIPTATNAETGAGKWSAGPDVALVYSSSNALLYGFISNNVWSFAGNASRVNVNQFFVQPFVSLNLPHGLTLGSTSTITANWMAAPNARWTVPLGGTITQLLPMGGQPTQIGIGAFYNVVRPVGGAQWQARLVFSLLFPTGG